MRRFPISALLTALLPLLGAGAALCCGGGERVKLPAVVTGGIVRGDHFFGLTTDGRVIAADLGRLKARELTELGFQLGPELDACGGRVAVRAGASIRVADAACGKVLHELPWEAGSCSLQFVGPDRLLVRKDHGADLFGFQSGKPAAVPLAPAARALLGTIDPRDGLDCDAEGKRIYVLVGRSATVRGGVAVIDLDSGNVTHVAVPEPDEPRPSRTLFRVVGEQAIVVRSYRRHSYGYGIYGTGYGYGLPGRDRIVAVDLKTGRHQSAKFAEPSLGEGRLIAGEPGAVYLVRGADVLRYDVRKNVAAKVRCSAPAGTLVGCWNADAVHLVGGRSLLLDMPPSAVQAP